MYVGLIATAVVWLSVPAMASPEARAHRRVVLIRAFILGFCSTYALMFFALRNDYQDAVENIITTEPDF